MRLLRAGNRTGDSRSKAQHAITHISHSFTSQFDYDHGMNTFDARLLQFPVRISLKLAGGIFQLSAVNAYTILSKIG